MSILTLTEALHFSIGFICWILFLAFIFSFKNIKEQIKKWKN